MNGDGILIRDEAMAAAVPDRSTVSDDDGPFTIEAAGDGVAWVGHRLTHVAVPVDVAAELRAEMLAEAADWSILEADLAANLRRWAEVVAPAALFDPPPPDEPDDGVDDVDLRVPIAAVRALWGGMEAGSPLEWVPALHAFRDAARAALAARDRKVRS